MSTPSEKAMKLATLNYHHTYGCTFHVAYSDCDCASRPSVLEDALAIDALVAEAVAVEAVRWRCVVVNLLETTRAQNLESLEILERALGEANRDCRALAAKGKA